MALEESVEDRFALAQVNDISPIHRTHHAARVDAVKSLRNMLYIGNVGHCSNAQPHLQIARVGQLRTISTDSSLHASPDNYLRRGNDIMTGATAPFQPLCPRPPRVAELLRVDRRELLFSLEVNRRSVNHADTLVSIHHTHC